ncbi:hypothetical protein [Aphanothece hegewaldii]|uniref:hypothetical protein n=1 Tax=Aphanothece hegewaldii TaxID=1521625 RepID=UPI0015E79D4F|nr:hypothetical protein [Aphanothece hegewaldii]
MPNLIGRSVYLAHADGQLEYLGKIIDLTNNYLVIAYKCFVSYYRWKDIGWKLPTQ